MSRAWFHAKSCAFILWLFVEPIVTASMFEIRKVQQHHRS